MPDDKITTPLSYHHAGVDIDAGEKLVKSIRPLARQTRRPGVVGGLGGFGALFDLKAENWNDPVLVSGTDGVGTKLALAFKTGIHNTIGIDLVAMCANDVLTHGADPLFFLDYFATGKLETNIAEQVVAGIAEGCRQAGCALIGGETAEMPGMYPPGHYDLAGFVVGAVERSQLLPDHKAMQAGDILVGIASSGLHSNGYSLVQKIVSRAGLSHDDPAPFSDTSLAEALLTPTRIYPPCILPVVKNHLITGMAHITGGGLTTNVPRICPDTLKPRLNRSAWTPPPVFEWLANTGQVDEEEMYRTFNMGIGLVMAVRANKADQLINQLDNAGEKSIIMGDIIAA